MAHYTRFRSYQLPNPGSSFSLSVEKHFTLIEARYNEINAPHIHWELDNLGKSDIDTLHITSWDQDHCNYAELCLILEKLIPTNIEYPSEIPTTENGKKSLSAINKYVRDHDWAHKFCVTPSFVKTEEKLPLMGNDIFFNPILNGDKSNDNSVIKFYRVGSFQILSLGDCEDSVIANRLMENEILKGEVDIMILAHHGADNGFTTKEFLETIKPKVCVCSSDYGNKYDHPRDIIRQRCLSLGIPLFTTKRGDIIAQTIDAKHFKVSNYVSNNEAKDTIISFSNKTWYRCDVQS
jgi:competence protein ComEC